MNEAQKRTIRECIEATQEHLNIVEKAAERTHGLRLYDVAEGLEITISKLEELIK